jgi:two-component system sensor histidine kinase/response regulator
MSGDQRDLAESLALERALLRTLIDWVPDFLYIKDLEGRFVVSNRAHFTVLGADRQEEVVGKTDFDVFPREFAERYFADEREVLRTGLPMVERAEPIVDKQQRKGWVLTTKSPLRDEQGRVTGLIGMGRDITAQRLAEEALAIERDLVRALMDGVPDYIYFKDPDGRFVRVNRAFANSHGRATAAEIIGTTDFDFFERDLAEAFRESERRIMATGEPIIDVEERNLQRDGRERWVSTTKVPLRDGQGNVVGVLGISRDITERKRGEERLMRSDKMASLGRLTAGIAHEMNTPLAAARAGLAELTSLLAEYKAAAFDPAITAEDHLAIGNEMHGALSIAETALRRAAAFVRGIKTQTRDMAQGERARFDAVRTIQDGLLLLEHDFKARGCTLKFAPERDVVELLGSPGRLIQVLSNLVINAVDACAAAGKGQILVALSANDAGAELRVADDGSGISPENLAKIFDPMFTTKPFGEGTGLGLTIVYDIVVAEFGGSIDVSSKEGQGTTFVVRFPKL